MVGTVTTIDSALPATQVLSQNPTAGSSVAPNTAVNLNVSSGPVTVPNVVDQPQATAEGNITGAGLTVGSVTTANDPVIVAGNVKADGIRSIEAKGPFQISGEKELMQPLDALLHAFVEQNRMKVPGKTYTPCYYLHNR